MFTERYRSHHDAERQLGLALGVKRSLIPLNHWPELKKRLQGKPEPRRRGVYFHVPHCDKICSFCNLNRKERKHADLEAYTEYLIAEIRGFGGYPYIREQEFETVYFGGGTPTVLSAEQLGRVLKALGENFPLSADCEITLESTQHNLGPAKAAALEAAGVNRFSIGIQTFSDRGRKLLGRTYDGEKSLEALAALRAAFGGILGIDIIYSYPEQSLEELAFDANTCISSGVDSVSFYSLMIQGSSILAKMIEKEKLVFNRDIESDRERHNLFYGALRDAGFTLLELTKLARPGKDPYRYIHIQYENGDLIPIGSGAGGTIAGFPVYSMAPGMRFVSSPNHKYDKYYRLLGSLQFGLYDARSMAGHLGPAAEKAVAEKIGFFTDRGFLEPGEDSAVRRLSPDGLFWGNNIAVEILKAAIEAEKEKETANG
jgi:oxygen-independent coproporphyrinogen-3 oxidase